MDTKELEHHITECAKADLDNTLQLITAAFFGLWLAYLDLRGEDSSRDIKIHLTDAPPGKQRTITIHSATDVVGDKHEPAKATH